MSTSFNLKDKRRWLFLNEKFCTYIYSQLVIKITCISDAIYIQFNLFHIYENLRNKISIVFYVENDSQLFIFSLIGHKFLRIKTVAFNFRVVAKIRFLKRIFPYFLRASTVQLIYLIDN